MTDERKRQEKQKKKKKLYERKIAHVQIVAFPSLQEIGPVFFFNCCAFPFSDAKSYGSKKKTKTKKKLGFTGLIF